MQVEVYYTGLLYYQSEFCPACMSKWFLTRILTLRKQSIGRNKHSTLLKQCAYNSMHMQSHFHIYSDITHNRYVNSIIILYVPGKLGELIKNYFFLRVPVISVPETLVVWYIHCSIGDLHFESCEPPSTKQLFLHLSPGAEDGKLA